MKNFNKSYNNADEIINKRFVNPYNFIPLMNKCQRSRPARKIQDSYTGFFECRMNLLTPLFIPNTSSSTRLVTKEELNKKDSLNETPKGYDFYSYKDLSNEAVNDHRFPQPDEPVIPGSEIRGMVRSVYEAAFNGCMSTVSLDRTLSRRTNEAKRDTGVLKQKNGKWILMPCKKAMLFVVGDGIKPGENMGVIIKREEYNEWEEGQEIWIKTEPYKNKPVCGEMVTSYKAIPKSTIRNPNTSEDKNRAALGEADFVQGWLHKGEPFTRKHHESVFYDLKDNENININDFQDIERLEKILEQYQDPKKNRAMKDSWYKNYKVSADGTLVYYRKAGGEHIYLSPACIGKEVFVKSIEDILKRNGGYQPCTGEELCEACKIFGMMEKEKKSNTYAYGSKVRITDACLIQKRDIPTLFEKPVVLSELGEPRPGAVEFYTKSPYVKKPDNAEGYWTYDYMCEYGKSITRKPLDENKPKIRGRKYYWHKEVNLNDFKDNEISSMKQRIRPLKAEIPKFCFRVYFEQLSKQQLTQLKWALDFGDTDCAHKLGRAKPLGFGSVQIHVDALHLRRIDAVTGKWEMESPKMESFLTGEIVENEGLKTVLLMANWKNKPEGVQYPLSKGGNGKKEGKNDNASHQWFTLNKGTMSRNCFIKVLPEAKEDIKKNLDSKVALHKLIKKGANPK